MLSNENDSNYFFFDQIKPLKQDRNFAIKHYVEYETYTVQNNLSTVKELKSYSQNVNDSAVAARKKQTSADISSNLNNYSNNSNTSTIMTKICPPTRRLTDDKSISKQINYYTWVEHSEQIVRDLSRLLHNQNVKAIKRPRILDYRLDATWEELIATTDDEMPRDWQVPTIKNAFDLWIQENPPEVNASGMKCETMKKMNYLYGFENANFHTPSPRSSLFRRRSSKSSITNFENKNSSQKSNDEKANEFQRTSRQMTTAKKAHKDLSPPKILLDSIPPESSYVAKKVDSIKDTQKNSSSDKENESNSTVGRSSKVKVPTSNRLLVSSKRLLSSAGERKAESRINGPFTIQFIMSSPACVEKGWTNENILVSFMNTMEWTHSRLTNAMKKNKADYYYEELQSVHYCQPQYITYSSLLGVKRLKLLSLTHLTSINDPTLTNHVNKCTTDKTISVGSDVFVENKVKLLFKFGFDKVKEERLPAMKIYQIMSNTSVPSLTSIQPYRSLLMEEFERHVMDNMTLLTIANLSVIKQIEMISRNIVKLNDRKDVNNNSEVILKLCMKKMASVLQSQRKSMKQIENTKVEQSHPWFSYSSDGTLTVRYPCGSPAIIWSSSPLLYHPSCRNIHSHDSSSVNRVKASDTKIKNIKETNPLVFTQRSNTNISSIHSGGGSTNLLIKQKMTSKRENGKQRTGFYLTLFDIPLNEEGRKIDGNSHKFDPQFPTSSNLGHDLMSTSEKESNLNLDSIRRSRNAIRRPNSIRDSISSSCSVHSSSNRSEMHSEQMKSDDRQSHNEDIYTENLATGPLIGQFTPAGEGVIYYPYNSGVTTTTPMKSNSDNRTKRPPINIHAIFTKDYCYVFNKSTGDLDYQFPRVSNKTLHDPTTRFPISLDISFNQYVRCIYANCNDLTVIFNTQNNILLNIDCFQNLYTFEDESDGEVLTPTEDGGLKQSHHVLSKHPFLSSIVDASSQNKQLLTSRRRKEEGLQKIFKQIPPIGDLQTLASHLQKSRKRISFLCDQWLQIIRFSLGLQRYRMPSPTSSRHQSVDYITKRFKTFTNMSDSFQNNDDNDSKPPNKSNTLNVSDQLNTGKKPIKSIDFHSERNDNRRDKIHRNELSKKSTVEKNDKLSEEELPVVEPTLIRSLTTGHNQRYTVDTSYSIEKEANIFPVACPVLLRLWLDEIKKDKYFKYLKKTEQIINKIPLESSCCLDNDSKLLTKAFMEVLYTPSKFGDSLLSNLAKISSKGCRCSRQIPPDITDLEFELFLSKLLPSYQAAVIMVYDSRLLDAMTVGTCSLLRQLYIRQQYTIPTLQHIFPGKSHTQSARANIPKRLYSGWKVTGTGACASVSTKAADYRFMCYNLAQNMNINEEEISYHGEQPLLLRRYYERPRPGDCLIFIKEKLCFIGSSFTGYEELPWTKEQLDRKVIECRNQLISHGFFLPPNFHLV